MRAQEPLVDGAEQVAWPGRPLPGFSGVTIEVETCTLHVYWNGPLPASITTIVDRLRPRMNVDVQDGPRYTNVQLTAVASELFDSPYRGMQAGVAVNTVRVRPQGTTVDVEVWPLPGSPLTPAQAAARAQQLWGAQLPVVVTAAPVPVVSSRWNDGLPWKAGGSHLVPGGGSCSTGWPMGVTGGSGYILTAAHCVPNVPYGTAITNGTGARVIGTMQGRDAGIDTAMIEAAAPANVGPRMWDGDVIDVAPPIGVNDAVEFTKPIVDWADTFEGMWLCSSGAFTGVHCNLKVIDDDVSYVNTLGTKVKKQAEAKENNGNMATGAGDSGGPIFSITGANADVVAVGVNTARDGTRAVPCAGRPSPACSSRVYFTKLAAIRTNWGLSNITTGGLK